MLRFGSTRTASPYSVPRDWHLGTPYQKSRHLPRRSRSMKSRATRDGDDYVLQGPKTWVSRGAHADWMFTIARTDPATNNSQGPDFFPRTDGVGGPFTAADSTTRRQGRLRRVECLWAAVAFEHHSMHQVVVLLERRCRLPAAIEYQSTGPLRRSVAASKLASCKNAIVCT